jgi:hypothetical protein
MLQNYAKELYAKDYMLKNYMLQNYAKELGIGLEVGFIRKEYRKNLYVGIIRRECVFGKEFLRKNLYIEELCTYNFPVLSS